MDENRGNSGARAHGVVMEGRQHAVITGVEDVACFHEQLVALQTAMGKMTLAGEDLRISVLNIEEGRVVVDGQLLSVAYDDRPRAKKQSLLKRLIR